AAEKPVAERPAKAEKPVATEQDHAGKRRRKRGAEAESASAGDKPAAEKPAAEKPPADKPVADKPASDEKPAPAQVDEKSSAAEIAAAAVLASPPTLKVTSTPAGALVLIDGKEAGTTPLVSHDVDPDAPHTVTIKKDGYDANERMVSNLDWSPARGKNPQTLKVNAKLHRAAAAAPAAAPKDNAAQPADDPGGPYIKEIKPDSP
ncbi:MAG TPA: PEGA domain-containing protein, partial [Polyangia bacterium]|nr:PEGA domain-containing protein [Polyangia bacterium]